MNVFRECKENDCKENFSFEHESAPGTFPGAFYVIRGDGD